jgi:hypothetical protein
MLLATLLVLLVVPVLGYVGATAIANSTGGDDALGDNLPIRPFPATPTAALVTTDAAGVLSSVTVFVLDPSGVGGTAINVPVSADVGFSDDARQSLQGVYEAGGADATWLALESLLVLTINQFREAGADDVAALLAPIAPIAVDLPQPVTAPTAAEPVTTDPESTDDEATDAMDDEDDDNATEDTSDDTASNDTAPEVTATAETVLAAGATELDAATAAAVLTTTAGGQPESTRRPNLDALWSGIAAAVGAGSGAVAPATPPTSFDDYMVRWFAGPVQTRGLSATPLTGDANPENLDVEEIPRAETLLVFGSIAPDAVSPSSPGLVFRLEAPPGYVAEVQRTIAKLLFLGGIVVSVDMTRQPQPNTVFIVPDEINRAEAGTTNMIFGDFTFEEPTERIDGVDLTVILGTDYLSTVDLVEEQ